MTNTAYSPQTDSSPTALEYWADALPADAPADSDNPGFDRDSTLVLVISDGEGPLCFCGCEGTKKNPKSGKGEAGFIQGHDQRLKGKLIRAGRNGAEVAVVAGALISTDAANAGRHLGLSPKGVAQVVAGIERPAKAPAAAKPAAPAGEWLEDGTHKVGRWEYPRRGFTVDGVVTEWQRNTKRDGSGEWVAV
jgi:hypothetical protein